MQALNSTKKATLLAIAASIFVIGIVYAYFSHAVTLPLGYLQTASVELETELIQGFSEAPWTPGEEKTATWLVRNTGTIPVVVKGYFLGAWEAGLLDPSFIRAVLLEQKIGETFVPILSSLGGIEEFFFSPTGSEESLTPLQPQETAEFRITTLLSVDAPDDLQDRTFSPELHFAAKQLGEDVPWPATY